MKQLPRWRIFVKRDIRGLGFVDNGGEWYERAHASLGRFTIAEKGGISGIVRGCVESRWKEDREISLSACREGR
jgi:hypothetical protein